MTHFPKSSTTLRTYFIKVLVRVTPKRPDKPDVYHDYIEKDHHASDTQKPSLRDAETQGPSQGLRLQAALPWLSPPVPPLSSP